MSATPQDVQAKIDAAKAALAKTTATYPAMVKKYGPDPAKWPATSQWHIAFADLDAARSEAGELVAPPAPTPTPTPTPTPATTGSGLALIAYGGSLPKMSHLTDDTYGLVVSDWGAASLLATCKGESYAYTVTAAGVAAGSATGFVILDPLGNSGLAGALTPDAYVAKCANLKQAYPGLDGIFLDNTMALGHGLLGGVTEAQFLSCIQHVSAGLSSHGLKWMANTGGYISGDSRSNDGSLWALWAKEIEPYFARLLCENFMEATVNSVVRKRLRGTAWYQQWDGWQKCVGAVPGKFVGLTFDPDGTYGVYGRASMLTAPGANAGNLYCARAGGYQGPDPYGAAWQKTPAAPKVDPVAGTASL